MCVLLLRSATTAPAIAGASRPTASPFRARPFVTPSPIATARVRIPSPLPPISLSLSLSLSLFLSLPRGMFIQGSLSSCVPCPLLLSLSLSLTEKMEQFTERDDDDDVLFFFTKKKPFRHLTRRIFFLHFPFFFVIFSFFKKYFGFFRGGWAASLNRTATHQPMFFFLCRCCCISSHFFR